LYNGFYYLFRIGYSYFRMKNSCKVELRFSCIMVSTIYSVLVIRISE